MSQDLYHVQAVRVLERVLKRDEPLALVVGHGQNIPLGAHVADLVLHDHRAFEHALERKHLALVLLAHEANLAKGATTHDGERLEVLDRQALALLAHLVELLVAQLGAVRLFRRLFELEALHLLLKDVAPHAALLALLLHDGVLLLQVGLGHARLLPRRRADLFHASSTLRFTPPSVVRIRWRSRPTLDL